MNALDLIDATVLPLDTDETVHVHGKYLVEFANDQFKLVYGVKRSCSCNGPSMVGECVFKNSTVKYCDLDKRQWACGGIRFVPI